jgi:hypothetical protein
MGDVMAADPMIAVYLLLAFIVAIPLIGYPVLVLSMDALRRWRVQRRLTEDANESLAFDAGRPRVELHPSVPRFFEPPSSAAASTETLQGRGDDQARPRIVRFPELQEQSGYDGTNLQLVTRQGERIH